MLEMKMRLCQYITQDIDLVYDKKGILRGWYRFIFIPYYKIIFLYRLLKYLRANNHQFWGGVFLLWYKKLSAKYNCELPLTAEIGKGIFFPHNFPVVINGKTQIGENVIIHPNVLIGGSRNKEGHPIIGSNVFLGNGSKIIGNCKIGDWVFVSPGAMITKDIPDGVVVGYGLNKVLNDKGKEMVKLYLPQTKD